MGEAIPLLVSVSRIVYGERKVCVAFLFGMIRLNDAMLNLVVVLWEVRFFFG
jgi:hypothetical protein